MAAISSLPTPPESEIEVGNSARAAGHNGFEPESLRRAFLDHLRFSRGKSPGNATTYDRFTALALTVRDRLANRWVSTQRAYFDQGVKRAYYLSAEYLLGRMLGNNLMNMGLLEAAHAVLKQEGIDLDRLLETEEDAGLGNGGLGRLAACFLDSMATLGYHPSGESGGGALFWPGRARNRCQGCAQKPLGGWQDRARRSLRRTDRRLRASGRQHLAPLGGPGERGIRPSGLQRWRLRAFGGGEECVGSDLEGALPERQLSRREGVAPQAAILLRRLLDRGHRSTLSQHPLRLPRFSRPGGDPAQRHAPGDFGGRADAGSRGREAGLLGCRLGNHRGGIRLHQPHPAPRSAGAMAALSVRAVAAPAPGNHLRDQFPLSPPGSGPPFGELGYAPAPLHRRRGP